METGETLAAGPCAGGLPVRRWINLGTEKGMHGSTKRSGTVCGGGHRLAACATRWALGDADNSDEPPGCPGFVLLPVLGVILGLWSCGAAAVIVRQWSAGQCRWHAKRGAEDRHFFCVENPTESHFVRVLENISVNDIAVRNERQSAVLDPRSLVFRKPHDVGACNRQLETLIRTDCLFYDPLRFAACV
jgi:hypothetical protein